MATFKQGDDIVYYSNVHQKEVVANVEYKGDQGCIVVHDDTRYSIQSSQVLKVRKKK